jgi:N-acetylglutamate synthase-like GNAT family acetyltransferase
MIREANKFDIDAIIKMLRNYQQVAPIDALKFANDEDYIRQLLTEIIAGVGFILVSERDGLIVGMIIAARIPNIWNPKVFQCSEVAYWVEPEYRGGTSAYRLISEYVAKCDEWKKQGRIDFYTVSKMRNSPDLKFNKFGFQQLEETWVN